MNRTLHEPATRLVPAAALAALLPGLAAHGAPGEPDWPAWRGPRADGIAAEAAPDPAAFLAAKPAWEAQVGRGYSAVTISGELLFTMGNVEDQDIVFALDPATGRERWRHAYDCRGGDYPGPRSTPVTDGERVYTVSRRGDLFCLDAATGRPAWHKNLASDFGAKPPRWGHAASPVIDGGRLLLNAGRAGLAVERLRGGLAWKSPAGAGGYATPVLVPQAGGALAAFFGEKGLALCEAATGRVADTSPWTTSFDVNAADPIFAGGRLFISSGYGKGCAQFAVRNGKLQPTWQNRDLRSQFSSAVLLDGNLYGIDGNTGRGRLVCMDWETGRVRWEENVGFGSLTAAGRMLLVLNERGQLILADADPTAYRERARRRVLSGGKAWTMPVLCRGRIYVRSDRGQLVCLPVR